MNSLSPFYIKRRALWISMGSSFFLCVLKFSVGFFTHSMAIIAAAVDSLMDFFISSFNFFSIELAEAPPDTDHRYGHGKIESLASLFQSIFIGLSGLGLIFESVRRLVKSEELVHLGIGIGMMVVSMLVTAVVVFSIGAAKKKSPSIILDAEQLHYSSDFLTNGCVVAALVLVKMTHQVFWDLLLSIGIGLYILKMVAGLFKKAFDQLMDRETDPHIEKRVESIVYSFDPRFRRIHDFRTRSVGTKRFIDFHIEIRQVTGFKKAHELTENLIKEIKRQIPNSDVTIHYDPEGAE